MNDAALAAELHQRLEHGLAPDALAALRACESICAALDRPLYLVGGAVRDLVLGGDGFDLDLAVEGEVDTIARRLAGVTGGRAVLHERFGTATLRGPGFALDLARSRRETYAHPGALPAVEPATLIEDLARRDFTINAIALRLTPRPLQLVDPYRGIDDARSSLLRVLHERSFQDDATRMLRAVRYTSRLRFKIARQTEALIGRDLAFLRNISGPRLRRELGLLFGESRAVDGALLAARLGILEAIHPALRLPATVADAWREALAGTRFGPLDELGFCVLAAPQDAGTAASVSAWLHLSGRIERALTDLVRLQELSPKLAVADAPRAVDLLAGAAPAAVWAMTVLHPGKTRSICLAYLNEWRHVRPRLDGDDLLALGIQPGPRLGEMLRRLRAGRLEGSLVSRDQEIEAVRGAVADEGKGSRL